MLATWHRVGPIRNLEENRAPAQHNPVAIRLFVPLASSLMIGQNFHPSRAGTDGVLELLCMTTSQDLLEQSIPEVLFLLQQKVSMLLNLAVTIAISSYLAGYLSNVQ